MRPLALLVLLALSAPARADIMPSPTRPDWRDPPAPLPDPPEEAALRWTALALALGAGAAAAAWRTRRRAA